MSVQTIADEKLNDAREHIKQAKKCLADFLDPDCYGNNQFKEEYKLKVEKVYSKLVKLQSRL